MKRSIMTRTLVLFGVVLAPLTAHAVSPATPWPYPAKGEPAKASNGMISSVSPIASRVGIDILKQGGNAVDAAIAVGLAMAVTWPEAGNIGGGGFMVARDASGKTYALDYRETAPVRATRDMFLDAKGNATDASLTSRLGAGTPGTVRGFHEAHAKLGKLPWKALVEPAVRLAKDGFVVDQGLAESFAKYQDDLRRDPEAARIFLKNGKPLKVGERLVQTELAATLRLIADQGPAGFYQGRTAQLIDRDMAKNGGIMTAKDLAEYQAKWREPIRFTYRGREIISMPPPSSGGMLLAQILTMLEGDDLSKLGYHSPRMMHLIAEVERRAYADRNTYLGDPDFVKNPLARLLDAGYLKARRATVDMSRATPEFSTRPGLTEASLQEANVVEVPETTHYVVADAQGNVVSNTYTLNGAYGSAIVVPGTGMLLNNEMDDFAVKPGAPNLYGLVQGERNAVAPKKRMLSSMSPSIVLDPQGRFLMAVGTPGGSTIPTTTLQVITNVIDFGMNARQAIEAPRFHHQGLPQTIDVEANGFAPATLKALEAMGHPIHVRASLGDAQLILRKPDGTLEGWGDPRKGGLAIGY
ncbi:Gamma-glutamyltranspeptidase precursor [compost metagenome]